MYIGAFILYPIAEIALVALVAMATSWKTAILLTILTTCLGLLIFQLQSHGLLFTRRNYCAASVENCLFANFGALLLCLPGFITDLLGLLIIIPPTRRILLKLLRLLHLKLYDDAIGTFSVFRTFRFHDDSLQGAQYRGKAPFFGDRGANEEERYDQDEVIDVVVSDEVVIDADQIDSEHN